MARASAGNFAASLPDKLRANLLWPLGLIKGAMSPAPATGVVVP
jgi:hypothetical protein